MEQKAIEQFMVQTGLPQGSPISTISPISPILYLFYNADLLEICDRPGTNISAVVRPAMTDGSVIWNMPKEFKKSSSISKIAVTQNKCLGTIAGAFKAINPGSRSGNINNAH